ncbi:MAG TPA: hypothetical protein VMG62_06510, partial [Solirubrobacteraceae bacterium]|nr:hypothetical protein [Solirubrobacteraceae bacterium]
VEADAEEETVERTLRGLHEEEYLRALASVTGREPVVMAELAPPGLEPDIPVCAELVAAAREAVRVGISAARRLAAGERFTYGLCRPPGHHAGPGWLAGYCYLNTAAAAVATLLEAEVRPVGVLDVDLHYPNGTAAMVAGMGEEQVRLHSLHAWPVTNVAERTVRAGGGRERVVEFRGSPGREAYLEEVGNSLEELGGWASAVVVSLGYDIVAGDPHGSWDFTASIFRDIGELLAGCGLPVCVIQEGGYALDQLAACGREFAWGLLEMREGSET